MFSSLLHKVFLIILVRMSLRLYFACSLCSCTCITGELTKIRIKIYLKKNCSTSQDHTDYAFENSCLLSKVNLNFKILTSKSWESQWLNCHSSVTSRETLRGDLLLTFKPGNHGNLTNKSSYKDFPTEGKVKRNQ